MRRQDGATTRSKAQSLIAKYTKLVAVATKGSPMSSSGRLSAEMMMMIYYHAV